VHSGQCIEFIVALLEKIVLGAVELEPGPAPCATSAPGSSGKSVNCARLGPLGTAVKASRLTPSSANCERTRYAAPARPGR
jgi:hypothetical protein